MAEHQHHADDVGGEQQHRVSSSWIRIRRARAWSRGRTAAEPKGSGGESVPTRCRSVVGLPGSIGSARPGLRGRGDPAGLRRLPRAGRGIVATGDWSGYAELFTPTRCTSSTRWAPSPAVTRSGTGRCTMTSYPGGSDQLPDQLAGRGRRAGRLVCEVPMPDPGDGVRPSPTSHDRGVRRRRALFSREEDVYSQLRFPRGPAVGPGS